MSETLHLIDKARGGDSRAFELLYGRHRGRLRAFVASRMSPVLAAFVAPEDIVQETHLESTRKLDTFRAEGPAAFYRWLVAIAKLKLSEADRARRAKKRAAVAPLVAEPAAAQTSPSGRVVRRERMEILTAALRDLPESQAEAVRLRYLEGLSIAETAERLDRSPAAIKALVSRGLRDLSAHVVGKI